MTSARAWKEPEPSFSEDAEIAVLGCILSEPPILDKVRPSLRAKDFYRESHRIIFDGVCNLVDQGVTPDEIALCDWLKTHDRLEIAGGDFYIRSLSTNAPPGSYRAPQSAHIILEHAERRAMNDLGTAYVQAAHRKDAEPAAEIAKQQARLEDVQRRMRGEGCATPEYEPLGVCMADVETEDFHWLWHGRVALGKLTMFDGDGGIGKSLATLDLAARVAMGHAMPDGSPGLGEPASVVIICGEDGLADTVKPRLLAAGASPDALRRIRAVNLVPEPLADGTISQRLISLLADLPALEATIAAMPAPTRLLIVDPITAYLGDGTDSHKDAEVRRVLTPLALMAERQRLGVALIRHLNRANGAPAQHRGMGSAAFLNVARLGLLFAPNPDAEGEVLMSRYKGNLTAKPPTLAYRITQVGEAENMPRISWLGIRETTAEAALAAQTGAGADGETRSATDEATEWLRAYLTDGPRPAKEAQAAARADGISGKPLRTARERLGIKPYRDGGIGDGGRWMWRYDAPDDSDTTDAYVAHDARSPSEGHLRRNSAAGQAATAESNGAAAKMPTTENGGHLSADLPPKMPSEDEAGHLSTTPAFNGYDTASEYPDSPKMPSPGGNRHLRAVPSVCQECGGSLTDHGLEHGVCCDECGMRQDWPPLGEGGAQ